MDDAEQWCQVHEQMYDDVCYCCVADAEFAENQDWGYDDWELSEGQE